MHPTKANVLAQLASDDGPTIKETSQMASYLGLAGGRGVGLG